MSAEQIGAEVEAYLADLESEYTVRLEPAVYLSIQIFHKDSLIAEKEYCLRPTWGHERWIMRTIRKHRELREKLRAEGARLR